MLAEIDSAEQLLVALEATAYTSEDVRRIIQGLGSKVERFFKKAVFPGLDAGVDFGGAINRLKAAGHTKEVRDKFHALRILYNEGKHDASVAIRQRQALLVVRDVRLAAQDVIAANPGQVGAVAKEPISHVLWLTGHDNYTGGNTEIYVTLPLPQDRYATHLDHIWIDFEDWDALKADLKATGNFYFGPEHFTEELYKRFDEDDFIGGGVWDGEYRQLIEILARHENPDQNNRVIFPRQMMYAGMLACLILAAIDVVESGPLTGTASDLSDAMLAQAQTRYGIAIDRPPVKSAAEVLSTMILQLSPEHRSSLTGPYWNIAQASDLTANAKPPDGNKVPLLIDDRNRIIIV